MRRLPGRRGRIKRTAMRLVTLPGVFTPLSDSWVLPRAPCAQGRPGPGVPALCPRSGAIAAAAARSGAGRVTAIDVSRRSVLTVRINARLNGVRVRALRGDLFTPVADERFDFIVSNPPYMPADDDEIPERGPA